MCLWLVQGKAPPSFLLLAVDIQEVDYVHLESDTRAVWKKENVNTADQMEMADSPAWNREEINP